MYRFTTPLGLVGLAAATAVIIWSGYNQVFQALEHAGWGILTTAYYRLIPMLCCVAGWRALMPRKERSSAGFFLYVLWLRSAIDNLMPAARIGGDIVAIRAMIKYGIRETSAVASTVVEITLSVIAAFLFDAVGIGLFIWRVSDHNLSYQLAVGLLLSLLIIIALLIVQHAGFFKLLSKIVNKAFGSLLPHLALDGARLDRAVRALYRQKKRLVICGFWELLTWSLGTGEIWLALYFLGHPVPLSEAIMIEAFIQASVSAAFMVPAALGVQEAGFVLLGQFLGLSPSIATALAVIKRCGDLLIYVPGLIVWQIQEGRWFLRHM